MFISDKMGIEGLVCKHQSDFIMTNPVLVNVTRGGTLESVHRGAISVFRGTGEELLSVGDSDAMTFPRSAMKLFQALPFVTTGAAAALKADQKTLALACASHSGEQAHCDCAAHTLQRLGLSQDDLACGEDWSFDRNTALAYAASGGKPDRLHHNCSGKHTAMLATAVHMKEQVAGYQLVDHPVQQRIFDAISEVTDLDARNLPRGTDGCSLPALAMPLKSTALGFARMATGEGVSKPLGDAGAILMRACMAEPFYVAGTDRFCTRLMALAPGRIFAKLGAEAVYTAALPELGIGMALKCDDGTYRGVETMVAMTLAHCLKADDPLKAQLEAMANVTMKNAAGASVGTIEPATALLDLA